METGNETCDALIGVEWTGNILHSYWFKTISKENGKADFIAINLLAEIVYWYRPMQIRDEETGHVIGYRKRFKDDLLQRSYDAFAAEFGLSKGQVTDAIIRLEKMGIITRVFRSLILSDRVLNNVLFIDLNFETLYKFSFPQPPHSDTATNAEPEKPVEASSQKNSDPPPPKFRGRGPVFSGEGYRKIEGGVSKFRGTSPEKSGEGYRNFGGPVPKNRETNTENTTEITPENNNQITTKNKTTTTLPRDHEDSYGLKAAVVDSLCQNLQQIGIPPDRFQKLLAQYGQDELIRVWNLLCKQKSNVKSLAGWFLTALQANYVAAAAAEKIHPIVTSMQRKPLLVAYEPTSVNTDHTAGNESVFAPIINRIKQNLAQEDAHDEKIS